MSKWDRQRGQYCGPVWVRKDRAGVCYFCVPVGLHVCDKRERPLPMFAQCMLSKWAPCFCTVCVQSVYAFQWSNNAVACRSQSVFVYRTERAQFMHFTPVWDLNVSSCSGSFFITHPFLWHTLIIREMKGWEEGPRREWRWGVFSSFFLLLCTPSLSCLIPPLWSTWQVLSQG